MIDGSFFIDHSEVIGLWAIYVIAMWLGVCILDLIFDGIKAKIKANKMKKVKVKRIIKINNEEQKLRVSQQIKKVMSEEI